MAACGRCGHDNAEGAKFCSECAAPLVLAAAEVRKTVTVVFCDLVGSTSLGESVDAEVLRSMLGGFYARLREVLEDHGGTVEKFIGDAVMAVFGIPLVHEDDALRAVSAAVRMREAAASLGLEVRIGVNTGEVMAGAGETLVTGDAVNVAARLEQGASGGEILVGEQTESLVRHGVLLEPVEPLVAKGKAEPVAAYRVVGLLDSGAPAMGTTPLVGRQGELAQLEAALRRAQDKRTPQLVTVTGAPGVGKSRLVAELLAGTSGRVLIGHCASYGDAVTYSPIVEALESWVGGRGMAALEQALAGLDDAEIVSAALAAAVGAPGAAASPEEIAWAFRKLCEALAADGLLVVVLDDIHWAEPPLLDLIEYVATFTQDTALVLLCTARPDLFEIRPAWSTPSPHSTLIQLEPLAPGDAASLVRELGDLPDEVLLRIVDASDGNPLFVEQLVAMHRDSPSAELEVPPSLRALLAARIDRLEAEERLVVERASVEGRLFHRGAVTALLPDPSRPHAARNLVALVRRELIRPDRATVRGDDAFRFGHLLIRDAAYESMPKRVRADLHQRYAAWLVARLGDDAPKESVGHHLEQAHGYLRALGQEAPDLADRAAEALGAAGHEALFRDDVAAAVKLLGRAVEVAREPARRDLMFDYARALELAGHSQQESAVVAELLELAEAAGDERSVWRARLRQAVTRVHMEPEGASETCQEIAETIIAQAAVDDHELLAEAWSAVGEVHKLHGRFSEELPAFDAALAHARQAGDRGFETEMIRSHGGTLVFGPMHVDDARRRVAEILDASTPVPAVQAIAQHVLAHFDARQGRAVDAQESLRGLRQHLRDLGQERAYAVMAACAWDILSLGGDTEAGERELREGYDILEGLGDKLNRCTHAGLLAEAAYRRGSLDEAERWAAISESLGAHDDFQNEALWRAVRAKLLSARGEHEAAVALGRHAKELADQTDILEAQADTRSDLAVVLLAAGDREAAMAELEQARDLYRRKGNDVSVNRTSRLLEELTGGR